MNCNEDPPAPAEVFDPELMQTRTSGRKANTVKRTRNVSSATTFQQPRSRIEDTSRLHHHPGACSATACYRAAALWYGSVHALRFDQWKKRYVGVTERANIE